jgi:hypothetical protein
MFTRHCRWRRVALIKYHGEVPSSLSWLMLLARGSASKDAEMLAFSNPVRSW